MVFFHATTKCVSAFLYERLLYYLKSDLKMKMILMTLDLQIKFNCASEYVYMFLEFGAYIQWAHESE